MQDIRRSERAERLAEGDGETNTMLIPHNLIEHLLEHATSHMWSALIGALTALAVRRRRDEQRRQSAYDHGYADGSSLFSVHDSPSEFMQKRQIREAG